MVQCGHRDILGQADNDLWTFYVQNLGVNKPDGEVIPISVYGDEVQVFDNKLYMCINWISEVTPYSTNSKASRFLVGLVPATMYVMQNKVNVTLQELLRCVVRDLNALRDGVEGLKGVVTSIRGDWKFLVQSLSLKFSYSTNRICFKCCATKNMECPFTDLSEGALWRTSANDESVWFEVPALAELHGFSMELVSLDVLHVYHLGVARDIVASTLVLLLKTTLIPGNSAPCFKKINSYIWFIYFFDFFGNFIVSN